jgi:hypothetical protein
LNWSTHFAFILLLFRGCATASPKAPIHQATGDDGNVKEYMNWFIRKDMTDNDIVGLSIALVDGQKI